MLQKNQKVKATTRRKRVFVNVETVTHFGRDMVEGILQFALENRWELNFEYRSLTEPLPSWFREWQGDGIISRSGSRKILQFLRSKHCPLVELLGTGPDDEAEISVDREEISRMIFSHFYERGFRNFAVYSFDDCWWSVLEKESYIAQVKKNGFHCHALKVRANKRGMMPKWSEGDRERLRDWLSGLPKPIGLYVLTDAQAVPVLETCRQLRIGVPDEISVVGVENDDWLCNLTIPPLSSVDQNGKRIGYLAAELLAQRMSGQHIQREKRTVSPLYICTRQSSDCIALENSKLVEVLKYIRENACNGLSVGEVVRFSSLSHATLGRLFKKWIGHSIEHELRHIRIEQAKQLLRETECSIAQVGTLSGFNSPEYFCYAFRQVMGLSPIEYRAIE